MSSWMPHVWQQGIQLVVRMVQCPSWAAASPLSTCPKVSTIVSYRSGAQYVYPKKMGSKSQAKLLNDSLIADGTGDAFCIVGTAFVLHSILPHHVKAIC